ncbi:hypothetical protein [Nocardia sp. NPDC051981]|uniref:hypothetical protein n=1 Tax=Nocardia sp. NPDC051981 TaxID=3155417 RepID=UPI0034244A0D
MPSACAPAPTPGSNYSTRWPPHPAPTRPAWSPPRADLLRRSGRNDAAAREYRAALDLTANEAERAYLLRRLAAVGG